MYYVISAYTIDKNNGFFVTTDKSGKAALVESREKALRFKTKSEADNMINTLNSFKNKPKTVKGLIVRQYQS